MAKPKPEPAKGQAKQTGKGATVNAKGALAIYRQVKAEKDQGK